MKFLTILSLMIISSFSNAQDVPDLSGLVVT